MFEERLIDFAPGAGRLDLRGIPILTDPADHEGIQIAVRNLASDLEKVTGHESNIRTTTESLSVKDAIIVVGSLGKSTFIQELMKAGRLSTTWIEGKWESFQTEVQDSPWSLAKRLLIIAGSDKRGTIYGVYSLSEQIGISPWYWWADIPIDHHDHIYALPISTQHGEPSVRYRGIFINDEAPALTDWVHENFGPSYNSKFYVKVFELLLRMKANFLWPAMWSGWPAPGSSFFADDPLNQQLADAYGIVISTSHHEPMQRSTTEWRRAPKGPYSWDHNQNTLADFFTTGAERARPFESVLTLGMRGVGDDKIEAADPLATMQSVIKAQRDIIRDVYGTANKVPQVLALYKEVQEQYDSGLEIPEDITLLFADDNFGNLRRLPGAKERTRSGGSGIYYHLEYVGSPRSYKWLNSNSCGKVHNQLYSAYEGEATRVWVFNVGDIKPMETVLSFALALAWDIQSIPHNAIPSFFEAYSAREFGSTHAREASELLQGHDRLMSLRRHEHIEPDTFSILHYREAENVLENYRHLERRCGVYLDVVPDTHKAAFFQLILHPIKASRINTELRIAQAKNQLFGLQRRNTTNVMAQRVLDLFDEDFDLSEKYHNSPWVGRKWNYIVSQPHYGYTHSTWHAPSRDLITGLSYIQKRQNSTRIMGQMGIAVEGHPGIRPGLSCEEIDRTHPSQNDLVPGLTLPPLSPYGASSRYFEIYTRGVKSFHWTASPSQTWVQLSKTRGWASPDDSEDQRIEVSINWESVLPEFHDQVLIEIWTDEDDYEQVHAIVDNRQVPSNFHGFVESHGCVAIDVGAVSLLETERRYFQHFPSLGRTGAGTIGLTAATRPETPYLEFPIFIFSSVPSMIISLFFTMSLDVHEEDPLMYEIAVDDTTKQTVRLLESSGKGALPIGWLTSVKDGIWIRKGVFSDIGSGPHKIKYRPLSPRVLLEKLVVDVGGVEETYLGPPSSSKVGRSSEVQ